MPRAPSSRLIHSSPLLLLALLSACDRAESRTETAGATVTAAAGTVPITAASEDARRLYLQGRDLTENLRAHDGRKLYAQALEADPSFAMAHYQLAVNSDTAKDFLIQMPAETGVNGFVALYGIESPGLTSCLAIADWVAERIT